MWQKSFHKEAVNNFQAVTPTYICHDTRVRVSFFSFLRHDQSDRKLRSKNIIGCNIWNYTLDVKSCPVCARSLFKFAQTDCSPLLNSLNIAGVMLFVKSKR